MKHLFQRISLRTLAPALALGLALGAVGMTSSAAYAEDNRIPMGEQTLCYYDGKAYSPGAKITLQDGTVQTCNKDGTWSGLVRPPLSRWGGVAVGGVLARWTILPCC